MTSGTKKVYIKAEEAAVPPPPVEPSPPSFRFGGLRSPESNALNRKSFRSTARKIETGGKLCHTFAALGNRNFVGRRYRHEGGVEIFPRHQRTWFKLINPLDPWYTFWTWLMIPALLWTAVALPVELSFVSVDMQRHAPDAHSMGEYLIFCFNRTFDLYFSFDLLLTFNVAFFDRSRDVWIMDRRAIAFRYLKGWFLADLLSILPYEVLTKNGQSQNRVVAPLFRLLRFSRAMKLLRVARIGRFLDWCVLSLDLPFRSVVMVKCLLVFFFTLHWGACACRLALDRCAEPGRYEDRDDSECQRALDVIPHFGEGVQLEYLDALHWTIRAITGDADGYLSGQAVLAIFLALWGIFINSYLIGEVNNLVITGSPSENEYRATCDNLRAMAKRHNFSPDLRDRLHKFLLHSSSMFHSVYERRILLALSPGLQHTVASEQLGAQISAIPFFRYAVLRSMELAKFQPVAVKSWNEDDDEMQLRSAIVKRPRGSDGTSVDVAYDDGNLPESEHNVLFERIVCGRDPETMRCVREVERFVRDLSVAAQSVSYIAGETLVHQGISWNDTIYILVEGKAVVFDQTRQSIQGKEIVLPPHNSVIGRDVCAYLCNRRKLPRRYTCKALAHILCYTISAQNFCELLAQGNYLTLTKGMAQYGNWIIIREAMVDWSARRRGRRAKQAQAHKAKQDETKEPLGDGRDSPPATTAAQARRKSAVVFLETPPARTRPANNGDAAPLADFKPGKAAVLEPLERPQTTPTPSAPTLRSSSPTSDDDSLPALPPETTNLEDIFAPTRATLVMQIKRQSAEIDHFRTAVKAELEAQREATARLEAKVDALLDRIVAR